MTEMQVSDTAYLRNGETISDAILAGYAPDGELYLPEEYPKISFEELSKLKSADYATVFYEVTRKFLRGALPDDVLESIARQAYSSDNFDFDSGKLRMDRLDSGIYVVGLSDGPTGAFKDMAMQPFARWVAAIRDARGISDDPLDFLISTSGDTGPAAQHAFSGLKGIRTVTMFPEGKGTSEFQRSQMRSMHDGQSTYSIEVGADFSTINDFHLDLQSMFDVSAVNSVNLARLIAQIPYHVASYLQAVEAENGIIGDPVDISIPSGNFGNGLAAIIARDMGVPIRNIIVATNENNVLEQFFNFREYPNTAEGRLVHTSSSAQDIRNASNIWRLFAMAYGDGNGDRFREWSENKKLDLQQRKPERPELLKDVKATRVDELARHAMMWNIWDEGMAG
ncbi:hypothetical protein KBD87_02925 [Candidatus Saccharibacteria bacterium]|nr:hypothetical protein [Candidatus Saccharibacteria bacterium]